MPAHLALTATKTKSIFDDDRPWIGDLALEPIKPGDRATLIRNVDLRQGELFVYGSGVYEGLHSRRSWYDEYQAEDHRFKLDTGETVWGVETWWGAEDRVKELYADLRWTPVPINTRDTIDRFSIVGKSI